MLTLLPAKSFPDAFGFSFCRVNLALRPGWQASKADKRSPRPLPAVTRVITYIPVKDCPRSNQGLILFRNFVERKFCFLVSALLGKVNQSRQKSIIHNIYDDTFPLLQGNKDILMRSFFEFFMRDNICLVTSNHRVF